MTRRSRGGDAGTAMMELVVGMALMSIFGGIFAGAVVMMTRTASRTESVTITSTQLAGAFLTLDETVRYAAALSTPGRSTGGDWYVELRTTNTGPPEVCTQLRIAHSTQQLQRRTWKVVGSVASGLSAWSPLASGITNGAVPPTSTVPPVPFALLPPTNSVTAQRLVINLVAEHGIPTTASTSTITIPAINSNPTTSSTGVCQEVGRP